MVCVRCTAIFFLIWKANLGGKPIFVSLTLIDKFLCDPSKFNEQKIQIMQGSHTDLSKTSNKSTECICVAFMLLVAFVLLITQSVIGTGVKVLSHSSA